jgi:hypothetical protein
MSYKYANQLKVKAQMTLSKSGIRIQPTYQPFRKKERPTDLGY